MSNIGWSNSEDEAPPLYRIKMLERGQATLEARIASNTSEVNKVWTELRIMRARIGVYAAIGATIGGAITVAVADLLIKSGHG